MSTSNLKVAFSASFASDKTVRVGPGNAEIIKFTNVFINEMNAYNPGTGVFTAPCSGAFQFTFTTHGWGDYNSGAQLMKNGQLQVSIWQPKGNGRDSATQSVILSLESGDRVNLSTWGEGDQVSDNEYRYVTFSGVLLFQL